VDGVGLEGLDEARQHLAGEDVEQVVSTIEDFYLIVSALKPYKRVDLAQ
jgi:hypothetical protein